MPFDCRWDVCGVADIDEVVGNAHQPCYGGGMIVKVKKKGGKEKGLIFGDGAH